MKRNPAFFIVFLMMLGVFSSTLTSCGDDDAPLKAEILVVDSLGRPVVDAKVKLFCTPTPPEQECIVEDSMFTNSRGMADFEFPLPVVLEVFVSRLDTFETITGDPNNPTITFEVDTACAETFIKIDDPDQTARETVILLRCPPQ